MEVTVQGGEKLAELARRCHKAGRSDLRKGMTRGIREETQPLVARLRVAARTVDMSVGAKAGGRHTGIRERIARSVRLKVKSSGRQAGVRLEAAMPAGRGEGNMPRHVDKGQWRHRVYGRGWATQRSVPGWWTGTINESIAALRAGILGVLDRVAAQVER